MASSLLLEGVGLDHEVVERLLRESLASSVCVRGLGRLPGVSSPEVFGVSLETGEELILKVRSWDTGGAFETEAHQLGHLQAIAPFAVPRVVAHGELDALSYLVLERLPGIELRRARGALRRAERERLQLELGVLLGRFHRGGEGPRFGEVLPRHAPAFRSWPEFFAWLWEHRVDALLRSDRLPAPVLDAVSWIHSSLPRLLAVDDVPRLIHGNLDSRKVLCESGSLEDLRWRVSGFIDPSLAYGHAELDLAMLEMCRAADSWFFEGYRSEHEIDSGYPRRKHVYMLYATLEKVRTHGGAHHVLGAMDLVERILRDASG